ncbi:MAG: hypothetical protein WCO09_01930 [bacterium]
MQNPFKYYLDYAKNNPKGYWFKKKMYGWGWTPVKWQGWIVIAIYIVLILGLMLVREKDVPQNPNSGSNILTFALPIVALTILLIIVAYKKGEKPSWQWGRKNDEGDKK